MDCKGLRILIVDDEIMMLDVLIKFFKRESFSPKYIVTASNGLEAALALGTKVFDIVISDFQYPPFDGLELLKRLRLGKYFYKNTHIPFLIMSGNSYEDVADVLEAYPPTAFISKPFDLGTMLSKIKTLL